jgi:hypothetical protein
MSVTAKVLASQLTQYVEHANNIKNLVSTCKKEMKEHLAEETLLERLLEVFNSLKKQRDKYTTLVGEITQEKSGLGQQILYSALSSLNSSRKKASKIVNRVFGAQCASIETQFNGTISNLNSFRQTPLEDTLDVLAKHNEHLKIRLSQLEELGKFVAVGEQDKKRMYALMTNCKYLGKIIKYNQPGKDGYLFTQLKLLCEAPQNFETHDVDHLYMKFDRWVQKLDLSSREKLHDKIRALANPQGIQGHPWEYHFKDADGFREAMTDFYVNDTEDKLKIAFNKKQISQYYQELFKMAFGPQGVDREQWVKSELPSLIGLSKDACAKVKQMPTLTHSEDESSSDDSDDAPSGESVDYSEHDITFDASHCISSYAQPKMARVPKMTNAQQIYNLIAKFSNIDTQNKYSLKQAIQNTLSDDLQSSLYGMISFLATDKNLKQKGWGMIHCADDMERLLSALDKLLETNLYAAPSKTSDTS